MRETNGERVSCIGIGRFGQAKKRAHHERDLIFSSAATTNGRLFDSRRWIFKHWQSIFGRGQNRGPTRGAEQNRSLVALDVNHRFKRATIWLMLTNQLGEPISNRDQTRR